MLGLFLHSLPSSGTSLNNTSHFSMAHFCNRVHLLIPFHWTDDCLFSGAPLEDRKLLASHNSPTLTQTVSYEMLTAVSFRLCTVSLAQMLIQRYSSKLPCLNGCIFFSDELHYISHSGLSPSIQSSMKLLASAAETSKT